MRIRLILSFLLVISLTLVGVSVLVRQSAQHEVQTFLGRGGLIGAETLVDDLETWYRLHGTWEGASAIMPHGVSPGGGGGGGGPQSGLRKLAAARLADTDGVIVVAPASPGSVGSMAADGVSGIPLSVEGVVVGYLLPEEAGFAQENALFEQRFLERIDNASLAAAMISGTAALVLAILLATYLIQPINVLVKATEKVAEGDLAYRVAINKPAEMARLGDTFNHMAEELEQADRRRKDLSSDIAHELRTPLAVQRAHLEALADGVFPLTKENLQIVQDQNDLLNRLVEDLRLITLADAGELELDLQAVDIRDVIMHTVNQFSAKAKEKDIHIRTDLRTCGNIQADAQRVQQILHNLLQNGLRHTPEHGILSIGLSCSDIVLRCAVRDGGPGIPEESLPYLFERFYRAERSRSKAEGGTGLGLSIARNLARAHGGSLTASNHPDGGAVFTLLLPQKGGL